MNEENFENLPTNYAKGWQGQDLAKFLLSMVQFTTTMLYLRKRNNTLPESLVIDPQVPYPSQAHRLYVQVRLEDNSPVYSTYVLYGFEPLHSNRVAFMCRKYESEVGVGQGLRGNHRSAIGLGYYTDDKNLRRLSLNQFLILTCPPKAIPCKAKGLLLDTPLAKSSFLHPLYAYSSCLLTPVDVKIAIRLSTNSALFVQHLSERPGEEPMELDFEGSSCVTPLPVGFFHSVAPDLATTSDPSNTSAENNEAIPQQNVAKSTVTEEPTNGLPPKVGDKDVTPDDDSSPHQNVATSTVT